MSKLTQDKDETISKQRLEIDQLHSSLNENSCSLSSLNEKAGKLEASRLELRAKLETAQGEISKLAEELRTKVRLDC